MAIFITYYKDVVFATITFTNYCGMYYNSYKKLDDADKHWFWDKHGVRDAQTDVSIDHPLLKGSSNT